MADIDHLRYELLHNPLGFHDASELSKLWASFNSESLRVDELRSRLDKSRSSVMGVFTREQMVGFICFGFLCTPLHSSATIEIWAVYVRPELRGMGVGKNLIERMVQACYKNGWTQHFVTSSASSWRFYEKCGFRPIDSVRLHCLKEDVAAEESHW